MILTAWTISDALAAVPLDYSLSRGRRSASFAVPCSGLQGLGLSAMALQLVPPQPGEEDSASNEGSSAEPCFADDSTDLTDGSASNKQAAPSGLDNHGFENDEDGSWITPRDMAILKGMGTELILMAGGNLHQACIKWLPAGTKPVRLIGEGAANAVFEIKVPHRDRAGQKFTGKYLEHREALVSYHARLCI